MTHLAVLGTGKMGSAIARRLAGIDPGIALWNRTRSRADALGIGHVADTPADAVRGADLVVSSLTGPDAVRSAYFGEHGALSVREPVLFVEMSTVGPEVIDELRPRVEEIGGGLLDAPILGAPTVVDQGAAAVLVGGARPDADRAEEALSRIGEVRYVGPSGSAARLKLVANSMLAAIIAEAAELQVAGEDAGLGRDDVFWVLVRMAPVLGPRRAGYLEDRHEPALFTVRDLRKDVHLALEMFARAAASTPITAAAASRVDETSERWPGLDITAVIRAYHPQEQSRSSADR